MKKYIRLLKIMIQAARLVSILEYKFLILTWALTPPASSLMSHFCIHYPTCIYIHCKLFQIEVSPKWKMHQIRLYLLADGAKANNSQSGPQFPQRSKSRNL